MARIVVLAGMLWLLPIGSVNALAEDLDEFEWLDPEQTAQLIEQLSDQGVELSPEDLSRLGMSVVSAGREPSPAARRRSSRGQLVWVSDWSGDDSLGSRLRFHFGWGPLTTRLRGRTDAGDPRETYGTVQGAEECWQLVVGGSGLHHGYGLFTGAPGRWNSLSSGVSSLPGRSGLTAYGGGEARRAVSGVGGRFSFAGITVESLVGDIRHPKRDQLRTGVGLARAEATRGSLSTSLIVGEVAGTHGASLALSERTQGRHIALELARWRDESGRVPEYAAAAGGSLRGQYFLIEAQFNMSASSAAPPLGQRPASLPGWDGRGWTLRCTRRLGDPVKVRLLNAQGSCRSSRQDTPRLQDNRRVELALDWRCSRQVRSEIKIRQTEQIVSTWSELHPWQPHQLDSRSVRQDLSVRITATRDEVVTSVSARMQQRIVDQGILRRQLINASSRWNWRPGWQIRGGWTWSWGDPLDLVTVIIPVTGMVLPRHWGKWATGVTAGLERIGPAWRVQLAGAWRRLAVLGDGEVRVAGNLEFWFRATCRWK